jgi:hypothetical protein
MNVTIDSNDVSISLGDYAVTNKAETEKKYISIFIAVPCYGDAVCTPFMQSVSKLCIELEKRQILFNFVTVSTESLITRARNGLMSNFLAQKQYTHLLFIDSDIEFDPISVIKLLVADKDVVGGIYPLKRINQEKLKHYASEFRKVNGNFTREFTDKEIGHISKQSLGYAFTHRTKVMDMTDFCIEVTDIATGFMMIKRGVLEKMAKAYPELEYQPFKNDQYGEDVKYYALFDTMIHPDTRIYLSEDYAFCKRWTDLDPENNKIFIRTDIDLSHIGIHYFRGSFNRMLTYEPDVVKTYVVSSEEIKKQLEIEIENE